MNTMLKRPWFAAVALALGMALPAVARAQYPSAPPPIPSQERPSYYQPTPAYTPRDRGSPESQVEEWFRHYLGHRRVDPTNVEFWSNRLRMGFRPDEVLARMLSSDEYYARLGGTDHRFVRGLYEQLLGREPTPQELQETLARFRSDVELLQPRGARVELVEYVLGKQPPQ